MANKLYKFEYFTFLLLQVNIIKDENWINYLKFNL